MMRFVDCKLIAVSLCVFLLAGCGIRTIASEMSIPSQDISNKLPSNLTKVVFFNDSNVFSSGLDGSAKLNMKLNGKAVGTINIRKYVQLYLRSGEYNLHLEHFDILIFKSDHKINIGKDDVYVRIYSRPTSNGYEIVDKLPDGFEKKFKPFNKKEVRTNADYI